MTSLYLLTLLLIGVNLSVSVYIVFIFQQRDKNKKKVQPSKSQRLTQEEINAFTSATERLDDVFVSARQNDKTLLRITLPSDTFDSIFVKIFQDFLKMNKNVELEIDTSDLQLNHNNSNISVGIRFGAKNYMAPVAYELPSIYWALCRQKIETNDHNDYSGEMVFYSAKFHDVVPKPENFTLSRDCGIAPIRVNSVAAMISVIENSKYCGALPIPIITDNPRIEIYDECKTFKTEGYVYIYEDNKSSDQITAAKKLVAHIEKAVSRGKTPFKQSATWQISGINIAGN